MLVILINKIIIYYQQRELTLYYCVRMKYRDWLNLLVIIS